MTQLIEAFRCLPGVGPKSAQRIALHLLSRNRTGGLQLAQALHQAMHQIKYCERCRTFSENPLCLLCQNQNRDNHTLCIVESPADVFAFEDTGQYRGRYFVLHGHLSPLDGIGPNELGLNRLTHYFADFPIQEVILATNPTVEGDATAFYIAEMLKSATHITTSRIAYGVPMGGELEYLDGSTLTRALTGRRTLITEE